jgi:hypothetical protein
LELFCGADEFESRLHNLQDQPPSFLGEVICFVRVDLEARHHMMWPLDAFGLVPERGIAGDVDVDSLRVLVIHEGLQVSSRRFAEGGRVDASQ